MLTFIISIKLPDSVEQLSTLRECIFLEISYDYIILDYTFLSNSWKSIVLCWIPSHVNIPGNERVSLPVTNMKLPGCDLIPRVSNCCLKEWQEIWSNCVNDRLCVIYHTVGSVGHNKSLLPS